MYQNISLSDFRDAFVSMDRKNQFSYEGLEALYNYLIEYEEGTGEKVELDVIALCCEYSEYENFEDFKSDTGSDLESFEELENETSGRYTVIPIDDDEDGGFIIQDF